MVRGAVSSSFGEELSRILTFPGTRGEGARVFTAWRECRQFFHRVLYGADLLSRLRNSNNLSFFGATFFSLTFECYKKMCGDAVTSAASLYLFAVARLMLFDAYRALGLSAKSGECLLWPRGPFWGEVNLIVT